MDVTTVQRIAARHRRDRGYGADPDTTVYTRRTRRALARDLTRQVRAALADRHPALHPPAQEARTPMTTAHTTTEPEQRTQGSTETGSAARDTTRSSTGSQPADR
jgi:hypothetical protein